MTTITLYDFETYMTYEHCYALYDDETGAEWVCDASNEQEDEQVRYINEATGEVLLQDEIDKYYVVGLALSMRKQPIAYIAKEAK